VILLGLAPSAFAASESGDAGDLPATAQNAGSGAVTSIVGNFGTGSDADMYRVCLSDGASFSASTVAAPPRDTQLFLFDADGIGVYSNDDTGVGVHVSQLPARHRFSPTSGGQYFLAASAFNNDPWSDSGEIFPDAFTPSLYPYGVIDASGPGAAEPVSGWTGAARGSSGPYEINLTGTTACDTTPPTVDLRSPADGALVKQGAELVVDFSCEDSGGSGLASCVGSQPDGALLDTSKLGQVSVTVTGLDNAGNQTVVTNTVTVVDQSKPTITLTTPTDGAVYERHEQVLADYSCDDEPNGSGLDTCVGSVADGATVDTASLGDKTFQVTATDKAGNSASQTVTYTVVDATPPGITITSPAAEAVYGVGEQVFADYSCVDEPGGSGLDTCKGSLAVGAAVDTGSVGEKTFTVETSDKAGNTASKTVSYTVADRTAPVITVTSPGEDAVYTLGESVLADYSCADEPNGSGLASCQGSVADDTPLDTKTVGAKTFEVNATDNAGNHATTSVSYSVVYDFDGFLWPLQNLPSVNRWKAGRPVPVRFSLGAYRGPAPVAAGYPTVAGCGAEPLSSGAEKARGVWKRSAIRGAKRTRWTYRFLWRTEQKWAGSCRQLVLKLDDDTIHRVAVQFVRHGSNPLWDRDWDE
jgi:hypothetical protein